MSLIYTGISRACARRYLGQRVAVQRRVGRRSSAPRAAGSPCTSDDETGDLRIVLLVVKGNEIFLDKRDVRSRSRT